MSDMVPQPYHLMIKPSGAECNLSCKYCYYLEKSEYYPQSHFRMDEATLDNMVRTYLQSNPAREVIFGWQGGEPLLMGIDFFRKALAYQKRYARPDQTVQNALQTNATLVNEQWAEFFAENQFLIGVSLDGPPEVHDHFRLDKGGHPTHQRVIRGVETLFKSQVECNALVTVNRFNSGYPLEVYRHLKDIGFRHIQFIPVVERASFSSRDVTPWSVRPEPFGKFLCALLDEWIEKDVGEVFVQIFESSMGVVLGGYPSLCVFTPTCGRAMAMEHNGDLYSCDHFVYPKYLLGNINETNMADMANSRAQMSFGRKKSDLPRECRECSVLKFCYGDCPKHRIRGASEGKRISYLCSGYFAFFSHAAPLLQQLARQRRFQ